MSVTRTLDQSPFALPQARTPLLGRDREARALRDLLADGDTRLVTITGPGGVGKTRLALHVASAISGETGGEVLFVPLAAVREPRLVLLAIGGAAGYTADPDDGYEDALLDYLHDRRALLVLDNLEQVISVVPALGRLLEAAPGTTVLATSQVALGLPEERVFTLAPLPTPDPGSMPAEVLARLDAVALFAQRARAIDPGFARDNDPAVWVDIARICRHLDGLPLAIELAAARANVMSPHTLLQRLEQRLGALGEYRGDVPDRLRTMRAAVGWNFDLLQPD